MTENKTELLSCPSVDFYLMVEWAEKAKINCEKQNRNDAAALWGDCLSWLHYLKQDNTRATVTQSVKINQPKEWWLKRAMEEPDDCDIAAYSEEFPSPLQ